MGATKKGPKAKKLNFISRMVRQYNLTRQMKKKREGELIETFEGHQDGINCLALAADESVLVSGSEDATARIWDLEEQPRFNPFGQIMQPVDPENPKCLGVLTGHKSYITCAAVFDTYVFTGSADATIKKWDLTSTKCMFTYKGHTSKIHKILVTKDLMFSTSNDKTARVWHSKITKTNRSKPLIRSFKGHSFGVYSLIYLPNGLDPDTEDEESDVSDTELDTAEQANNSNDDLLIAQGDAVITGSADFTAKIWSLYSGECLYTLKGHTGSITSMATDPEGKKLYTASSDGFIRFWEVKTGKPLLSFEAHKGAILSMSVNHRLMYTAGVDGTSKCWVTEHGDNTLIYKGHTLSVTLVKFYKGLVVTGCGDGTVRCFDAKSGHLLRTFEGHEGSIMAMQMAGEKIFTATTDGTIRIFKIDWEFVKDYLSVLAGDVEYQLGDEDKGGEPVKETALEPIEEAAQEVEENEDQKEDIEEGEEDEEAHDEDDHDSLDDEEVGDDEDDEDEEEEEDEDEDNEDSDEKESGDENEDEKNE